MKKVLFLSRRFLPHIGGVELHIQNVINELLIRNYSFTIITEQDNINEKLIERRDNVEIRRISLPNFNTNKIAIWKSIISDLKIFLASDIIHIHDVFFWIIPIYPVLKLYKKEIFITFHGHENENNPKFKHIFWHKFAQMCCTGNICIGGFHSKWYKVKPTLTTFGAANVSSHKPQKNVTKSTQIRFIYLGRLANDNGLMDYLSAISLLPKKLKFTLDIFGNGPLLNSARHFCLNKKLNVNFHGFVDNNKIDWQSYNIAFVSRYLAIIECLSIGIPVIAHYNSEIKKDYLVLTPFSKWISIGSNPSEIKRKIQLLIDTQSPNIIEAQQWAKKQSWKKMSDIYEKLWIS